MWGMWDHQTVLRDCAGPYPGPYKYLECVSVVGGLNRGPNGGPIWPLALFEIFVAALLVTIAVKVILFYREARRAVRRCEEMDTTVD